MYIFKKPKPLGKAKKRSRGNQALLDLLNAYIESEQNEQVEILMNFWKDQGIAITYKEIKEMVEKGEVSEKELEEWSKDYSILVQYKLYPMWKAGIEEGARAVGILNNIQEYEFDASEAGIINWITQKSASCITNMAEEQRDAVQMLILRGYKDEIPPDKLARMIRPCIGLNKRQANAVYNYHQKVIENLKKEHPRMKSSTIERKAEESAARYKERLHRSRAKAIAQTELAEAYNNGADFSVRQAQKKGYIGHVKKVWVTARQNNVCQDCEQVEGVSKEMDELFEVGRCGMKSLPPAHPHCRCVVKYVEVKNTQNLEAPEKPIYDPGGNYRGEMGEESLESNQIAELKDTTDKWSVESRKELLRSEETMCKRTYEKMEVYGSDGEFILSKSGKADSVNISVLDYFKLKDSVVTHNHPSSGSFSFADLKFLKRMPISELRVSTVNGVYYIRKPKTWPEEIKSSEKMLEVYNQIEKDLRPKYKKMYNDGKIDKVERHIMFKDEVNRVFSERYGIEYGFELYE